MMENGASLRTRVDLALSQVKRVEREVRIAKQMLGRLSDELHEQSTEDTSNAPADHDDRLLEVV